MLRRNLELKARCRDLPAVRAVVEKLGARPGGVEVQTDTYFGVLQGRLKLRVIERQPAVLIWYDRPNQCEARLSNYYLADVVDPPAMKALLAAAFGQRGEVRKRREILFWHNVRIHLDEVTGLGTFVEFEAVLGPDDEEAVAQARLRELSEKLDLQAGDLVAQSYADLLIVAGGPSDIGVHDLSEPRTQGGLSPQPTEERRRG